MRLFRPQPRITPASRSDAASLADLYARAWQPCRGLLPEALIADQAASAPEVSAWLGGGFEVFAAQVDGALAGAIRCSFPTGTCLVDRLAVAPDRWRRGLGRALGEHAVGRARRAGVAKIWVQVPASLEGCKRLFRELGFRESSLLRAHYWGLDIALLELHL